MTLSARALPVQAEGPSRMAPRPLAWAFSAMARGDWDRARDIALRDGAIGPEIIEWQRLRAGRGSATEVLVFLAAHPDWPGLALLRRQSEDAFREASDAQVLAFFDGGAPGTPEGTVRYAQALAGAGRSTEAETQLVRAWREMPMPESLETRLLADHAALLAPHHAARAEAMFWEGASDDQQRMADRLTGDAAKLSEARRLARAGDDEADAAIRALPKTLRSDAALTYARFRAAMNADRDADARKILLEQSELPEGLGRGDLWAPERRLWAREEMWEGDPKLAYQLAAQHQLSGGANFADLEWLAGYIALRQLDQPRVALGHFQRLTEGVETPISLARAQYWAGRAQEALGNAEGARAAYAAGAEHQTTFYGLLSAERGGLPFDEGLGATGPQVAWRGTPVESAELRQAAMLLDASGQSYLAELFLLHYAEGLDETGQRQLSALLESGGHPHLAVRMGKLAASGSVILPRAYFPLHPMADMSLPIAKEMALAIARRESEFDPAARSHVGASGLMQLMPGTAVNVAAGLGIDHEPEMLTRDWPHNVTLGSAYLAELAGEFRGNVVLMSVGYNAGPHRARAWIERNGDPRDPEVDIVDWIEAIPYRETRNYVQRVAESLPIYRARLGRDPLPVPFSAELAGSTLMPLSPEGE